MLIKNNSFIKPKLIGIDITDGQLTAAELRQGIYLQEDVSDQLPTTIWQDQAKLRSVYQKVIKQTGSNLSRPTLFISVPANILDSEKRIVLEASIRAGAKRTFLAGNLAIAAIGAGIETKGEDNLSKKIYLLPLQNISYLGIVFSGGSFNVRTIEKSYHNLTINDIEFEVNELLNNLPCDTPESLKKASIPPEDYLKVEKAWQSKVAKQIYITVPMEYKGCWGDECNDFKLIYTEEGEQTVIKGLMTAASVFANEGFDFDDKLFKNRSKSSKTWLLITILIIIYVLLKIWRG